MQKTGMSVVASTGPMQFLYCWLFHRRDREVLLAGILPGGLDAVVFCWRCDRMRGRAVQVLQLRPQKIRIRLDDSTL